MATPARSNGPAPPKAPPSEPSRKPYETVLTAGQALTSRPTPACRCWPKRGSSLWTSSPPPPDSPTARKTGVARHHDPVFPSPQGGLRDPSNTQADLRQSLAWCGLPWVTSHAFRKTTATLLDNAGLSARTTPTSSDTPKHVTQNVYMGRKIASTQAAQVLEQLA